MLQLACRGVVDEESVSFGDNPDVSVIVGGDADGVCVGFVDEVCLKHIEMVDGIAAEIEVVETALQVVHVVVAAVVCEDGLAAHLYVETTDFARRRIHPEGLLGGHYEQLPLIGDESGW